MSDAKSDFIGDAIKLTQPIIRGETIIDSLSLRKPNGLALADVELMELARMKTDVVCVALPRIAEPTITEVEALAMGAGDLFKIGRRLSDFLLYPENHMASPPA